MRAQGTEARLRALGYLLRRTASYRAVSARAPLVGGLLSIAVSGTMLAEQLGEKGRNVDARDFFAQWSLVFVATLMATSFFLWREARRRGEPFVSGGLKLVLASMLPALFAGAAIGGCLTLTSGLPLFPALFWVVFYGLALLSLSNFAPTQLIGLGWAFLITGLGFFIYLMNESTMAEFDLPAPTNLYPAAMMGVTFGCYHLIYAALTWRRRDGQLGR